MLRDGGAWFVLTDVCRVLEIGNTSKAAVRLDDDEKDVATAATLGGPQSVSIIKDARDNAMKQLRPRLHVYWWHHTGEQNMSSLRLAALVALSAIPLAACTINPPTPASTPTPVVVQTPAPQSSPTTVVVPRPY